MHCVHIGESLFPTGFSFSGCGAWSQNVSMMLGSKLTFSIETTQKHLRALENLNLSLEVWWLAVLNQKRESWEAACLTHSPLLNSK